MHKYSSIELIEEQLMDFNKNLEVGAIKSMVSVKRVPSNHLLAEEWKAPTRNKPNF